MSKGFKYPFLRIYSILNEILFYSQEVELDPLSQAVFGATAAQAMASKFKHRHYWSILTVGALGGLVPDLDVLITSTSDSLLQIEYHRHFTHSLFFVPFIGAFVSCLLFPVFKKSLSFKEVYLYSTIGALTHGFLDACTSYGTHLFWPLSLSRESWSIISIVDPLFTLPLIVLSLLVAIKRSYKFAHIGLIWICIYLGFGAFQHYRAKDFYVNYLAKEVENKKVISVMVKPTIANLWVWRGISVYDDYYRVDGLRLGVSNSNEVYTGRNVEKFTAKGPWEDYKSSSQVLKDLKRFKFFSEGLIYNLPERPEIVGDLRYSLLPHSIEPLWVVELDPGQKMNEGLEFYHTRNVTKNKKDLFIKMLFGKTISQEDLDNL